MHKTGDRVTLMFGLDGNVSDILLSLSGQNDYYALILDAYSRESTKRETFGEKQYFVNLLHTDGSRQTCLVASDMNPIMNSHPSNVKNTLK